MTNQSINKFYHFNKISKASNEIYKNKSGNKLPIYRKKLNLIYIFKKEIISVSKREEINKVIFESHNYQSLSSSFYSYKFKDHNINQCNSIKEYSISSVKSEKEKSNHTDENNSLNEYFYLLTLSLDNSYKRNIINPNNLSYMFYGCSSIIFISGISNWNTIQVKNMDHMFEKCSSLKNIIDLSQWELKNLVNISDIFRDCS